MSGLGHGSGEHGNGEGANKKIALLYELGSAALQIGIVLASAGVITGIMLLPWISGGLGVVGIVFSLIGLFAPQAVHLF